jgi:hypothetical protein
MLAAARSQPFQQAARAAVYATDAALAGLAHSTVTWSLACAGPVSTEMRRIASSVSAASLASLVSQCLSRVCWLPVRGFPRRPGTRSGDARMFPALAQQIPVPRRQAARALGSSRPWNGHTGRPGPLRREARYRAGIRPRRSCGAGSRPPARARRQHRTAALKPTSCVGREWRAHRRCQPECRSRSRERCRRAGLPGLPGSGARDRRGWWLRVAISVTSADSRVVICLALSGAGGGLD